MEESITLKDFLAYYKKTMRLEPVDAGSYSPLVLAYIGDAVYEVMIRARVINRGSMQVNKMHKRSAMLVNAGTQAQLIRSIEEELTPQEPQADQLCKTLKSLFQKQPAHQSLHACSSTVICHSSVFCHGNVFGGLAVSGREI